MPRKQEQLKSATSSSSQDKFSSVGPSSKQESQENLAKALHIRPKVCCVHPRKCQMAGNASPEPTAAVDHVELEPSAKVKGAYESPQQKSQESTLTQSGSIQLTIIDSNDCNDDHRAPLRGKRVRDQSDLSGKRLFEDNADTTPAPSDAQKSF